MIVQITNFLEIEPDKFIRPGYAEASRTLIVPPRKNDTSWDNNLTRFVQDQISPLDKVSAFLIPIVLSQDYLNFTGLRLGLHIRYSNLPHNNHLAPLIFLGVEDRDTITQLNSIGSFLFTKGVHLVPEDYEQIAPVLKLLDLSPVSEQYITQELPKRVYIDPPEFYDSKHALVNYWAPFYMAHSGGFQVRPQSFDEEFFSSLYVKRQIHSLPIPKQQKVSQELLHPLKDKSILVVDDMWEVWQPIINKLLSGPDMTSPRIDYVKLESSNSVDAVVESVKKMQIRHDYDLILLDLQILDSDKQSLDEYWQMSGFDVLSEIKDPDSGNPGQQVAVFSASSNIHWYEYARSLGANAIVVKPGFDGDQLSYSLEDGFYQPLRKCLEYSYLSSLFDQASDVEESDKLLQIASDNAAKFGRIALSMEASSLLRSAASLIESRAKLSLESSLIILFRVIELTTKEFIERKRTKASDKLIFKDSLEPVPLYKMKSHVAALHSKITVEDEQAYYSIENQFRATSVRYLSIDVNDTWFHKQLSSFIQFRNAFVHKKKYPEISSSHILAWYKLIHKALA